MKKLMKFVIGSAVVLVLLVVIGVVALYFNRNRVAKAGIEKTMSYVLDVPVTVEKVNLSPFSGEASISGLKIANPKDFQPGEALTAGEIRVEADLKSFATDQPHIKLISLTGPQFAYIKSLRSSNIKGLIDNASRLSGDAPPDAEEPAEAPEGAQMKILIDKVVVDGAAFSFATKGLEKVGQEEEGAEFTLPKIEINDFGGKDNALVAADALKLFFTAMTKEAVLSGKLPADVQALMNADLDGIKEAYKDVGKQAKDLLKGAGGNTGDLKDAAKGAGDKLKGLLNK